ncbi:hypothetical protein D3C72_2217040 [compost metagenome]
MRHNARTCGKLGRKADKAEILIDKQANIHSHFCQGCGNSTHGLSQDSLGFATSHLCINHIVV